MPLERVETTIKEQCFVECGVVGLKHGEAVRGFLSKAWGMLTVSCALVFIFGASFLAVKYLSGVVAVAIITSQIVLLCVKYIPEFRSKSVAT